MEEDLLDDDDDDELQPAAVSAMTATVAATIIRLTSFMMISSHIRQKSDSIFL
ncbi:hypothetical protein LDBUL1632_01021 [Lactobacillus delbrueckii subsp. bulgaricus CNCM I-1632]|nr:hypothetical protein LDBUL1632_01021 [Lactobacillus delbrueckii subsp. bulgaricus CNCM I-1632]